MSPLPAIPDQPKLQEIKSQINIADLIGSFTTLKRAGNHLKGTCPLHDDKDPSLAVYQDSFYCYGCRKHGDALDWVRYKLGLNYHEGLAWLADRVGKIEPLPVQITAASLPPKPVNMEQVEYFHGMLKPKHRAYFHSRLFTDATINRELWGWSGDAYTIPVWKGRPQESECVGIRMRRSGGDGPRYYGIRGSNGPQLYNAWALEGEPGAFVMFGELDAALATQDGYPAVSPTNGCASWDDDWDDHFRDKSIGIVIVPDFGEERFAHKVAEHLGLGRCRVLNLFNADVKDYNDWRLNGHRPIELLERLQGQYDRAEVEFDF